MTEGLVAQAAVGLTVGALVHLAQGDIAEQVEHLLLLRLVLVERLPGVVVDVLQLLGRHVLGLEHHLTGVIVVPVKVEDTALAQQVVVNLRVGERCQHGKLRQVKVYLAQEVDEPLAVVLGLVVESQEDSTFNTNAVVMVALHAFLNIV